ncbi:MAG: hypothetical protein OXG55_13075 [bacterium]|nr:hypothetical protein [bacterium]
MTPKARPDFDPKAPPDFEHLRRVATAVRRSVISAVHHAGAGHVGGPLSATDLLAVLYFHELRIDPAVPCQPRAVRRRR